MVKKMKCMSNVLIVVIVTMSGVMAGEPSVMDLVKDKYITPELMMTLPYRNCSTPQNAFLGFLRSNAEGNLRDYLFYLTPQARKAIAGVEDENAISDDRARGFEEAFKKAGFRNFKLESFHIFPDTSPTQIVAVISSSRGRIAGKEQYDIGVVQTNGLWKFVSVGISPIERKPTTK